MSTLRYGLIACLTVGSLIQGMIGGPPHYAPGQGSVAIGAQPKEAARHVGVGQLVQPATVPQQEVSIGRVTDEKQDRTTIGTGKVSVKPVRAIIQATKIKASGPRPVQLWQSAYFEQAITAYADALRLVGAGSPQIGGVTVSYVPISDAAIANYQKALSLFSQVYRDPVIRQGTSGQALVIDGTARFNYIVAIIKSMTTAFVNNLQLLKSTIIHSMALGKSASSYLDLLNKQANRYDTATRSAAVYVQKNWDALYQPYSNAVGGIAVSVYAFVLSRYAQRGLSQSASVVEQAYTYFQEAVKMWDKDLTIAGFSTAQDALESLCTSMAQIAYNAFQTQLNMMVPEGTITSLSDVMGSDNRNRALLKDALAYITMAAQAYTTVTKVIGSVNGNFAQLALAYTTQYQNLNTALQSFDNVLSLSSQDQAGALGSVVSQLAAGGAQWLAGHIARVGSMLEANAYAQQGIGVLAQFKENYGQRIIKAASVTTTLDVSDKDTLTDVVRALGQACQKAGFYYQQALSSYADALQAASSVFANGPLLTASQQQTINRNLTVFGVQDLLQWCQQGGSTMAQGLSLLSNQPDSTAVIKAQTLIGQALTYFGNADNAYQKLQPMGISVSVPFYALVPNSALQSFFAQYSAHRYRVLAASLNDDPKQQLLKADYYVAAFAYQRYLAPAVQRDIINTLKHFSSIIETARQAIAHAQQQDAVYKSTGITTGTLAVWDVALSASLAAYTLWNLTNKSKLFSDGPLLYSQCVQQYIQSYAVQGQAETEKIQALLYYRLYLFGLVEKLDAALYATAKKHVQSFIHSFLAMGADYVTRSTAPTLDPQQGYQASLTTLNELLSWQSDAEDCVTLAHDALQDQMGAAPGIPLATFTLIQKTVQGSITTYTSPLVSSAPSVSVGNTRLAVAQLYQKQGDWALAKAVAQQSQKSVSAECVLDQGLHGIAASAYGNAATNYRMLGNVSMAEQMTVLSSSEEILAIADLIGNAPVPMMPDTQTFGTFLGTSRPVYAQYFLFPWIVEIPPQSALISVALLKDNEYYLAHKTDLAAQARVEDDLRTVAAGVYLYRHIQAAGLAKRFKYDYLTVIEDTESSGGITDQALLTYVKLAQQYRSKLTQLMSQGLMIQGHAVKTKLMLVAPANRPPALVYCNLPVAPVPAASSQDPAGAIDPTAIIAYAYALGQYQGFHSANQLQQNYVQSAITRLQAAGQDAYLSEAYALFKKIDYMQGKSVPSSLLALIVVDDQERGTLTAQRKLLQQTSSIGSLDSAQAQALVSAISWVQDYFAVVETYVNTAATASATTGQGLSTAVGLLGYCYEQHADFLQTCLVGDPTATQYQAYIDLCSKMYLLAQGTYQQAGLTSSVLRCQQKRAQLFEHVGMAYVDRKNYIASLPYFNAAQQLYQAIGQDQQYQQSALRAGLSGLVALFKGATEFFISWYQARWSSPLALPSGASVASFEQLVADCTSAFAYTQEEQTMCNQLQSYILDALIYYTAVDNTVTAQAQTGQVTLTSPTNVPVQTTGQSQLTAPIDPAIQAYLRSSIAGDKDLTTVLITGNMAAAAVREMLNGFLLQGNATRIDQLITSKDLLAQALSSTKLWTDYVFQAIAACYIANYLSSLCAEGITAECIEDQYSNLIDAMQAEEQNILAPAQQYVG